MATIAETHDRIDSQKGDLVQVELEFTYPNGQKRRYWVGEELGGGSNSNVTIRMGEATVNISLVTGCVWRKRRAEDEQP
jgi:hypothetical protein